MIKSGVVAALAALFTIQVVLGVWVRFTNPDLTETRLLLEYWPLYLISSLTAFGLIFAINKALK